MAHARKVIRDQIKTSLTGLSTTGSNVTTGRSYPVAVDDLPALFVYSGPEEILRETLTYPRDLERTFTVMIEAVDDDKSSATAEDTMDTILKEVEVALGADPTLSSKARDSYLQSVEVLRQGDQERTVIIMRMEYVCIYRTKETAPETLT